MNSCKVRYSCFLVCLSVLLGFSWSAPAAAGDAADLRLAAGPIQSPQTKPLVGGVEANPTQPQATSVTPKTAGSALVPANARIIKVEGLTRQQFDQLKIQPSDVIEYKGKQYNVGTLLSQKPKAEATVLAARKQKETEAQARFDAYRTNFSKVQLSNLAVANAKTDAMAKQLLQRMQASGKAPPASKPIPVIEGTTKEATPGGDVYIAGYGFGNPIGQNTPGFVYLNIGNFSHPVAIKWWSDTLILGTIPPGLSAIPDIPGTLVVKMGGGIESNLWPVKFIAAREVVLMHGVSPRDYGTSSAWLEVSSCDASAVFNDCRISPYLMVGGSTFSGHHTGDLSQWANKGNDVYKASLLRGWTFESAQVGWYPSGPAILKGFNPSSSSLTLVVDWYFDVWSPPEIPWPMPGDITYTVELYIVGPRGVPYH